MKKSLLQLLKENHVPDAVISALLILLVLITLSPILGGARIFNYDIPLIQNSTPVALSTFALIIFSILPIYKDYSKIEEFVLRVLYNIHPEDYISTEGLEKTVKMGSDGLDEILQRLRRKGDIQAGKHPDHQHPLIKLTPQGQLRAKRSIEIATP